MEILLVQKFLVAIGIGALVGVEREREKQGTIHQGEGSGFRSFILIAMLGGITSYLNTLFSSNIYFVSIFAGFSLLIALSYYAFSKKDNLGIITEMSSLITFLLGFISLTDYTLLAVILVAMMVILIESDRVVHQFIKGTSQTEWLDTLKFAAIALIIYPILPNEPMGPGELINPSTIWLLVVLISGIEFIGYFLMKTIGSKKGVILNGFLGGLVSSTAVTLSMTNQSKKYKSLASNFAAATTVASVTMFGRMIILVGVVAPDLFLDFLMYALPSLLTMAGLGMFMNRDVLKKKASKTSKDVDIELGSPFSFVPAVKMAIMFAAVKIVVKIADTYLGNSGIYLSSMISGLVDVDAITLSISGLFNDKTVLGPIAVQAILIGAMANTLVKGSVAKMNGAKEFGNKIMIIFGGTFLVGVLTIGYLFIR